MTNEPETGTLAELNVKPGDEVEHVRFASGGGRNYNHTFLVDEKGWPRHKGKFFRSDSDSVFRIVSRASQSDTPKMLKEMTDAEIGALMRAHKEGKVIQAVGGGRSEWIDCDPQWRWDWAYRIRPEPVRETVKLAIWRTEGHFYQDVGTIDLIDGKPDCASIRMEEL